MNISDEFKNQGYAPGDYFVKCGKCGKQFSGDKRAWVCFSCAAEQISNLQPAGSIPSHLSEAQAVVNEIRKRIIEDKEKLKIINKDTQISGHIRCELIVREVLRDYEKGEHFS